MALMEGDDMDLGDASWWGLALAFGGALLGWRVATAKDSVHIEALAKEMKSMNARLRNLENKLPDAAREAERVNGIIRTLDRHERAIDRKVDK